MLVRSVDHRDNQRELYERQVTTTFGSRELVVRIQPAKHTVVGQVTVRANKLPRGAHQNSLLSRGSSNSSRVLEE